MARKLEETRAALLAVAWPGAADPPGRTDFIIARSKQINRFMPAMMEGVAIRYSNFPQLIAFAPGGVQGVPDVVPHELTHQLSRWFLPIQPLWFAEGLATYLQTVRYYPDEHEAKMGMPPSFVGKRRSEAPFTPSELLATGALPTDGNEATKFYIGAWLFTHYLMNHESERFGDFQVALGHLNDWRNAWSVYFREVQAGLNDAVWEAAKRPQYAVVTTSLSVPPLEASQRPLTQAEVHGIFARAFLIDRERHQASLTAEVDAALRLDPGEINALASSYYGIAHSNESRTMLARRAVAAHPESAMAWLMLAGVATTEQERAQAATNALRADPFLPGALLLDARTKIAAGHPEQALKSTKLALRLGAPSVELLRAHSVALAANHRCRELLTIQENHHPELSEAQLDIVREGVTSAEQSCAAETSRGPKRAP